MDDDGSGQIEFEEFLKIIKSGASKTPAKGNDTGPIYKFFKDFTDGAYVVNNMEIPFKLLISKLRRECILDSMMSNSTDRMSKGKKILNNYKNQLA